MSPPILKLCFLGSFYAEVYGKPTKVRLRSMKRLLALLALRQGREVSRQFLADTIWCEHMGAMSPTKLLSQHLCNDLRHELGPAYSLLQITPQSIYLTASEDVWVDVIEFDKAMKSGTRAIANGNPSDLERAVALYRGHLCEDELWMPEEQVKRLANYRNALELLTEYAIAYNQSNAAITYLGLLTRLDRQRETWFRMLMKLHASLGEMGQVRGVYLTLCRNLREDDLKAGPDAETLKLYEELRNQRKQSPHREDVIQPSPSRPAMTAFEREIRTFLCVVDVRYEDFAPPRQQSIANVFSDLFTKFGRDTLNPIILEELFAGKEERLSAQKAKALRSRLQYFLNKDDAPKDPAELVNMLVGCEDKHISFLTFKTDKEGCGFWCS